MKKSILLGIVLALATMGFLFWYQSQANEGLTYSVKGKITGFGDRGVVFIFHEDIPGVMASMTMPFTTRTHEELNGLQVNDVISFTYHLSADDSWISDIQQIRPDQLKLVEEQPSIVPKGSNTVTVLQAGDLMPDMSLKDQDQRTTSLPTQHVSVVSFMYTMCPDPKLCPRTSDQISQLQTALQSQPDVHLYSISFDPKHDSPEVLKAYGKRYTRNFDRWSFLTGDEAAITRLTDAFGIHRRNTDGNIIDHNLTTAILDAKGKIIKIYRDNDWTTQNMLDAIQLARKN